MYIDVRGNLLREPAHMIMEAGKSYETPFASLRARKPGALRPPPMSKGRKRWMWQLKKREIICPSFGFLFHLNSQLIGWFQPTLVSPLIQRLIFFSEKHIDTPRNTVLWTIWASHNSIKLTHQVIHHN